MIWNSLQHVLIINSCERVVWWPDWLDKPHVEICWSNLWIFVDERLMCQPKLNPRDRKGSHGFEIPIWPFDKVSELWIDRPCDYCHILNTISFLPPALMVQCCLMEIPCPPRRGRFLWTFGSHFTWLEVHTMSRTILYDYIYIYVLLKLIQFYLVLNIWISFSCLQWQPDLVPLVSVTSNSVYQINIWINVD